MEFALTEGQLTVLDGLINFLEQGEGNPYRLVSGSAGVGKTYMISALINHYSDCRVLVTAPTNKAVKVLNETLQGAGVLSDRVTVKTIHKALSISPKRIKGDLVFDRIEGYENYRTNPDIIIVDECSMIGVDISRFIFDEIKETGIPFIFLGDFFQLPPVKEDISVLAKVVSKHEIFSLIEIVRQAKDSPIIKLATRIRASQINYRKHNRLPDWKRIFDIDSENITVCNSRNEFARKMITTYKKTSVTDIPMIRVLAWTNKTVEQYNRFIRKLFNPTAQPGVFEKNESIIFISPLSTPEGVAVNVDQEGFIMEDRGEHEYYGLRYQEYIVNTGGEAHRVNVLSQKSKSLYKEILRAEKAKAEKSGDWDSFWNIKGFFTDIRNNYSITVHRSQGSTFNEVFVDVKDITDNWATMDALKCLYVAVTRPKYKVTVLL